MELESVFGQNSDSVVKSTHEENSSVRETDGHKPRRRTIMGHKAVSPPAILSSQFSPRLHLLLLFLLLLASSGLSCKKIRNVRQCMTAPCAPGYNLVGESLDAVTYERKDIHPINMEIMSKKRTCYLCPNPLQGNQLQTVPFSAHSWKEETIYKTKVINRVHSSVTSLVNMVKSKDIYDWKVGADLKVAKLNVGGEHYDSFEFAKSRNDDDHYTFSSHWQRFCLYRHAVSNKPRLNDGFKKDVKKLPRSYNSATKDEYREFIRKYGTHYIHRVTLGGQIRRLVATRTCLSRLNDISTSKSKRCLSLDLKAGLGLARLKPSCSKFVNNWGMKGSSSADLYEEETEVRGGDPWSGSVSSEYPDSKGYRQWMESLKRIPMIVDFIKEPLYDLVNDEAKRGLKDAINAYMRDPDIKFSATNFVTERSCSHHGDCCPERLGQGWLTVTILRGFRLYGDVASATEGYVEISYGGKFDRTRMIRSNDPQWDETFNLGLVDTTLTLTLELRDKDPFREERLFYCKWDVRKGSHPLSCKHEYGVITAEYTLECGPHLTGDKCDRYEKMSLK